MSIQVQSFTTLTPQQVAAAFCEMDSAEQAAFFIECKRISSEWPHGMYGQSLWMRDELKPGTPGADFIMDLAAPWYTHTLMYTDNHGERERA